MRTRRHMEDWGEPYFAMVSKLRGQIGALNEPALMHTHHALIMLKHAPSVILTRRAFFCGWALIVWCWEIPTTDELQKEVVDLRSKTEDSDSVLAVLSVCWCWCWCWCSCCG